MSALGSHPFEERVHTRKLERPLKVVKDKLGKDAEPVVMLEQHQLRSVLDRPMSLHDAMLRVSNMSLSK